MDPKKIWMCDTTPDGKNDCPTDPTNCYLRQGGLDVSTGITTGCCRTGTITTGCSSTTMCHELIRHAGTLKYDGIGSSHNLNHGRPQMVVEKDGNHHVTGKFHIHHFIIARLNHLGCRTIMKQTKQMKNPRYGW